ncbi:hemerythrin domain-containing protein [Planctomicrobium piriforme]|uniref:Hemerythrin HHE cation binding domain-containing protein n=1 Tax=Planctomicrobium piriforme TaxID=1576369 RepID=A0A1I3B4T0_9PLAN|nr:hemerythrin domain-containing protein [Planctomicrobium piriforme]SFH56969.1 Hemerythrin HHE cation binding domain-containing protein [Planctomicrobium piriforme]
MRTVDEKSLTDQLHLEQQRIDAAIADWRQWWTELKELGKPHFGEMGMRLSKVLDRLTAHFEHEERTGFLVQITNDAGADPDTPLKLIQEHDELLNELKDLIHRLQTCCESGFSWGEARRAVDAFLERLRQHEHEESELTERGKTFVRH